MIMQTIQLKIGGMTCGGCSGSVKRVLEAVTGVSEAQVDLAGAQASVTFDPAQTNVAQLVDAVENAGFDAAPQ